MKINFTKMQGLGNDFMVIDGINQKINLDAKQIAALAQRNTGVGFDQCLLIEPSLKEGIDFNYRIFNADGQEVGQCGNGARCLGQFLSHYGLTHKKKIRVATKTTTMVVQLLDSQMVRVEMGVPESDPAQIPFVADRQQTQYELEINGKDKVVIHAISVGNPHAVLCVNDVALAPVSDLGSQISLHPRFPQQANVGFMQLVDKNHLKLRVYERGCGETQACGSGAVAAAAIARLYYQASKKMIVNLTGGDLIVEWPDFNSPITLTGPASFVYEGTLFDSN